MANSNGWGDGAANNAIGWGQGANNNIGWGDSHAKSWAGATDIVGLTTDADAQAFITAAAITDATQQTAIDTLVKGMKADGTWTKMKAIYPFVGGTATTHKYNLKDPRDLDAAFRLVFNGGWTHSSTGATPNGTNGYADTKLNASTVLTKTNHHISYYGRTQTNAGNTWDMGSQNSPNDSLLSLYFAGVSLKGFLSGAFPTNFASSASTNTLGLHIGVETSSTNSKLYQNSTLLATNNTLNSTTFANIPMYLGAANIVGVGGGNYSTRQCAFSTIGDGLTDTDATNLYTRVQAFQTSLSRQV